VGCLRNSVNVGLWYSFAKNFCTDKAPFCTYRRMVSVFAKLFPFFSLLLSKVVSDFIQKLHKKKKKSFVVKHSVKERERETERRKNTFSLRNTIISFNKTCCRFISSSFGSSFEDLC
jgi:hypothetical protein